jgi:hypothetical protein
LVVHLVHEMLIGLELRVESEEHVQ